MKANSESFEAYLKCPTKCWLRSRGEAGQRNAYAEWVKGQDETYRAEGVRRLQETLPEGECVVAPPTPDLKAAKWRLAIDLAAQASSTAGLGTASSPEGTSRRTPAQAADGTSALRPQPITWSLESRLHAVERLAVEGRGKKAQFSPIRFIFKNKPTRDDRLLVAFDALLLSELLGRDVSFGKMIHGDNHATLKIKTARLLGKVRKSAAKIAEVLTSGSPPDLVLNPHCNECEFREACRQKAFEKDDLSLLATMTEKERKKFRSKGIFTVTQLSYTFRPRRRPRRMRDKRDKYYHSLKALAIREKKTHIVGRPELRIEGTPVYLDVEGLPDRDFYYLIGVRIGHAESPIQHSLWADTAADEGRVWRELLAILETVEKPVMIHYGNFEKIFWRRMSERHGKPSDGSRSAKAMISAINLVSFFFAQIYFPTYSNHLKDVASWHGFSWSDSSLFGPNSVACRCEWEASRDPLTKQRLITYNVEDCKALELLHCLASRICQRESPEAAQPASDVIAVDKLKPLKRFNLISKDGAAIPEFKEINKAAYWDYQRERVYVRSSKVIRRASQRIPKRKTRSLPIQGTVEYPIPSCCPRCGGADLQLKGKTALLTYDVRFMRSGVKGLVRRQVWPRYYCAQCRELVRPDGTQFFTIRKYGVHLRAYATNQLLELRISGGKVAKSLNQIFHFALSGSLVSSFKSDFAQMYGDTVKALTARIVTGALVHADETQAHMVGKTGYVWVLSSLEEVVYLYSDSREGDMIWSLLESFRGVLVSDFYAVYDSIKCPQQKCLIHLMRDINDDLHKYPFDEELRKIAQAFAGLLKPMVETIDKHGLKRHFLAKYVVAVEKYYSWLTEAHFASEVAAAYEKRFCKYRDKLFVFLKHDNVPWNNNNAENAIRAFGELRDIIKGVTTEKGLREYLVLLSICETCKRRGISFIDFLCSGETDLERFLSGKSVPSRSVTKQRGVKAAASQTQEPVRNAAIPESPGRQPASLEQWQAEYETERREKELEAWSRFGCPGSFPWPEIVGPLVRLEKYDAMPIGGALAALPALVESGLAALDQLFPTTVERAMQESSMALIAQASVSRSPSIEAIQRLAPTGWKRILFSDRLPDDRALTALIRVMCTAPLNIARWKAHCVMRLLEKLSSVDAVLSVNGTQELYVDWEKGVSGTDRARRMLLVRCNLVPWAQALKGRPFLLICGVLSSARGAWLCKRILSSLHEDSGGLRMTRMQPMLLNQQRVTVILGAGGLLPAFFERLLKMGYHVLSYLLSEEPSWADADFMWKDVEVLGGQSVRLQFAERALPLADGVYFRELRCPTTDTRQIRVISSDSELDLAALAGNIMIEFRGVSFLDYLRRRSALDELCAGIVNPSQEKAKVRDGAGTPRSSPAFGPYHAVREFLNAMKLISFRAESMLAQIISERVSQPDKVLLMLRELLNSPADLVPNLKHETMTVRLHPQFFEGCEEALLHLCAELNATETVFPATDLRLVYEAANPR